MKKIQRKETILRIPYDLYLKLAHIAKKRVGNTNGYIQQLISQDVEKYEREHGTIPTEEQN